MDETRVVFYEGKLLITNNYEQIMVIGFFYFYFFNG